MADVEPSATAASGTTFLDLSLDVLELIIAYFKPATGPLFIPSPIEEQGQSDIERKTREYYGEMTDEQLQYSENLLSWSVTCWHFRRVLAPHLLNGIILRTREKSLRSIEALSRSKHWNNVKHFVFMGTDEQLSKDDVNGNENMASLGAYEIHTHKESAVETKIRQRMQRIAAILSRLPPDLESLTLDFPTSWPQPWYYDTLSRNDLFENDDRLVKVEQEEMHRALLFTVLNTVSTHHSTVERNFELTLNNFPPFPCSVYAKPHFRRFLGNVTAFRLYLSNFGHPNFPMLNCFPASSNFAERLDVWFLNHLQNVHTLKLHADRSWPLGLASKDWGLGYFLLPLRLPATSQHLSKLRSVSFRDIFIGTELLDFLNPRTQQLESIELVDCYCGGRLVSSPLKVISWGDFFDELANANLENLVNFSVRMADRPLEKAVGYRRRHLEDRDLEVVNQMLKQERGEEAEARRNGASDADICRRRRWMFRYCGFRDGYWGDLYDEHDLKAAQFLVGMDYFSYVRIVEIVEANMKRKRKPFFSTWGTTLPPYPRANELLDLVYDR